MDYLKGMLLTGFLLCCFLPLLSGNRYHISILSDSNLLKENGNYSCRTDTTLTCRYWNDNTIKGQEQIWWLYSSDTDPVASQFVGHDFTYGLLDYTPSSSGVYKCQYYVKPDSAYIVHITLSDSHASGCEDLNPETSSSSSSLAPSTTTTLYHPTTSSNSLHSTSPSPSSSSPQANHFKASITQSSSDVPSLPGLNPLIYTTMAAILLVALTLVSIVTCWLRSRKMSSQRTLLPQETPQDYLDYIREGQFTPLTTSEFLASLHERPPTYGESQDIQRRMDNGDDDDDDDAPPIPPPRPPVRPTRQRANSNQSHDDGSGDQSCDQSEDRDRSHDQSHDTERTEAPPTDLLDNDDTLLFTEDSPLIH